jgi:hypothetical protein
MAAKDLAKMDLNQLVYSWLKDILWPEKNYFWLAIIYGVGIALLGLATPISVQLLINSIANTALPVPLFLMPTTRATVSPSCKRPSPLPPFWMAPPTRRCWPMPWRPWKALPPVWKAMPKAAHSLLPF